MTAARNSAGLPTEARILPTSAATGERRQLLDHPDATALQPRLHRQSSGLWVSVLGNNRRKGIPRQIWSRRSHPPPTRVRRYNTANGWHRPTARALAIRTAVFVAVNRKTLDAYGWG